MFTIFLFNTTKLPRLRDTATASLTLVPLSQQISMQKKFPFCYTKLLYSIFKLALATCLFMYINHTQVLFVHAVLWTMLRTSSRKAADRMRRNTTDFFY
ncbi:hypothetical protein F7725_003520 [Dissostichus mawsoni]|uniref:Uncharacterized protein n=1 Tax=Dissostichus mawsoni TaxID=36200 RepID=A0A7J5YAG1_DISMA|nr:hypothetical protein F7725_003520 [Dissostichus mawsoni]